CDYREVVFTGSATEANNLAIRGIVKNVRNFGSVGNDMEQEKRSNKRSDLTIKTFIPRIITSQIEHESILETCRDLEREGLAEVIYLPVSKVGIIDIKKLKAALNERTVLVSIMYANNEVGSIQPIKEISKVIRQYKEEKEFSPKTPAAERVRYLSKRDERGEVQASELLGERSGLRENYFSSPLYPLFHTDAAQAFNYLDCDIKELGVDMMTLSSQKIYGPKGIGLLYIRNFGSILGEKFIKSVIVGGHQEEGLRAGTENVAGIAGFAEAAQISSDLRRRESARILRLQNYFWKSLKKNFPGILLNGPAIGDKRLPNNINIYFPHKEGLIYKLDMAGFAVSSGSACSARISKPSHVLLALGWSDIRASESLRISFGRQTDTLSVKKFLNALKNAYLHQ
ncbi:MAG: cysteine desulfurase, partial [Patescibacteria group bacterium]|nr:cysteine desulfurase [Patescibacteria group bacterium]